MDGEEGAAATAAGRREAGGGWAGDLGLEAFVRRAREALRAGRLGVAVVISSAEGRQGANTMGRGEGSQRGRSVAAREGEGGGGAEEADRPGTNSPAPVAGTHLKAARCCVPRMQAVGRWLQCRSALWRLSGPAVGHRWESGKGLLAASAAPSAFSRCPEKQNYPSKAAGSSSATIGRGALPVQATSRFRHASSFASARCYPYSLGRGLLAGVAVPRVGKPRPSDAHARPRGQWRPARPFPEPLPCRGPPDGGIRRPGRETRAEKLGVPLDRVSSCPWCSRREALAGTAPLRGTGRRVGSEGSERS